LIILILLRKLLFSKQFIRITKDGKVDVLFKDKLIGKEQLLLYLIGSYMLWLDLQLQMMLK
jgi:hypothetical protein